MFISISDTDNIVILRFITKDTPAILSMATTDVNTMIVVLLQIKFPRPPNPSNSDLLLIIFKRILNLLLSIPSF
ncbi:hypothetical protein CIAM_27490 [Citrobacter amalonaticus]|nr:hypothetical protein CIAM_27490 [Citrobacter amalonaticus]